MCAVPREKWPQTRVSEAMVPVDKMQSVAPDTELWDALQNMDRKGVNQLPVLAGGRIEGVLTRENLVDYLQTILQLR
jgi:CBS domain-containing protein